MPKSETDECYFCGSLAASTEHVPPKCLFPEQKDISEQDHRKNLITVPSCDEHNSRKSADDEFLMVSLAGIIGNNSIGYRHKFTKVNRAIYRSSFALLEQAMRNQRWEVVEIAPNKFLDVIWGTPDQARLNTCFDRIARGLFYQCFRRRFRGVTKTIFGYLQPDSPNAIEFQRFIRDKINSELKHKQRLGDNPDVFSFQFTDPDSLGLYSVHLRFYGGLDIYTALLPQQTELPPNLAVELMNRGIHTIIRHGEDEYYFNVQDSDSQSKR